MSTNEANQENTDNKIGPLVKKALFDQSKRHTIALSTTAMALALSACGREVRSTTEIPLVDDTSNVPTAFDDKLVGSDDLDTFTALAGDDEIYGGEGDDSIEGGVGDDLLSGEAGDDTILGGDGVDVIHGGEGDDILSDTGNSTIYGDSGNDIIYSRKDEDTYGSERGLTVYGGDGDDQIINYYGGF